MRSSRTTRSRLCPTTPSAADEGKPEKLETAVFPAVAKFTRVCLYDRPNTTVGEDVDLERGGLVSTPVPQPHALGDDVADLHALLAAAGETGPFVLAAHSYGGLIAELYARRYPQEVAGEVLVDVTSVYLRQTFTAGGVRGHAQIHERADRGRAGGAADRRRDRRDPRRPCRAADAGRAFHRGQARQGHAGVAQAELMDAHDRLAMQLGARHVTETASGHHIHVEQPQLVSDAIRDVVDAVRGGKTRIDP